MTPDEAKTMMCCGPPMAGAMTLIAAGRKPSGIGQPGTCIGPACMAWRWSEAPRTEAFRAAIVEHMKATGDNASKATQELIKQRERFTYTEGYCGLAGASQ